VILTDTVTLDATSVRTTRDGYLVADARIARTGIQTYTAAELGLTDRPPADVVRIYRPADEVFNQDAMASLAHRPVTVDHPSEMVTADNWKKHTVGMTGGDVARDGDFIRVPLTMMDADAIRRTKAGKNQLSVGYTCDMDWTAGTTDSGEAYDGVQRNIRGNHLATCDRARGGPALRIGDNEPKKDTTPMKTITFDGLPVADVSPAAEAVILKLQGQITDAATAVSTAEATHATAIAAKDAEIATKDAEIATLKGQVLTADALDAAIVARSKLVEDARKIAGADFAVAGLTDADIRKGAVLVKLGDSYADKPAAFFDTAFELQLIQVGDAAPVNADPIREAIKDGIQTPAPATSAYDAMKASLSTAWQDPKAA